MTILQENKKRIEAFEFWVWRRIQKVSYAEHKTNEEVLHMVQEERTQIDIIRKLDGTRMAWKLTSKDGVRGKNGRKENCRTANIPDTGVNDGQDKLRIYTEKQKRWHRTEERGSIGIPDMS